MTTKSELYRLVRAPKNQKEKNPLLLLLHGYGSNEEDLFSFKDELPDDYYVISVRAPYSLTPYGYAWYAIYFDSNQDKFSDNLQAKTSRDLIVDNIDSLISTYPIDPENITLVGFSQGCILSLAVALSYPEKISRVVGLSGYINPEILKEGYEKNDFSKLNIFISHGFSDQVIPVDWARKTPVFLDRLGIKNSYKEYPSGHGISPHNFFDFRDFILNN